MTSGVPVLLALDAGGSTTKARAVRDGRVVHQGTGGCGSPRLAPPAQLARSYADAMRGSPAPAIVVAGVAGAANSSTRRTVWEALAPLAPAAHLEIVPDYVIALRGACPSSDVCVVAGTGSVVCSARPHGVATSGGAGWLLGDPGSAVRLGQLLLARVVNRPDDVTERLDARLVALFGSAQARDVLGRLHSTTNPELWLARAAPLLTGEAEAGSPWAAELVHAEMGALADLTAHHLWRHCARLQHGTCRVGLVGGVWGSALACSAFVQQLRARTKADVVVASPRPDPLDGALALATESRP